MKNIIDFCKEYNYIPLPVPSNEFSVTNVDLPDGYSVLTKTLEDIFQSFYPKTLKNKFKNKFNEELYGVLIYFSFLEMFQVFIDTNKAKLIKKNQNVGDYRLDSSFVNEFFWKPSCVLFLAVISSSDAGFGEQSNFCAFSSV